MIINNWDRVFILFIALMFCTCADQEKQNRDVLSKQKEDPLHKQLKDILSKKNINIIAVAKFKNKNIVILKAGESFFGDMFITTFSKKDKLLKIILAFIREGGFPFFYNDKYLSVRANKAIITYDSKGNQFYKFMSEPIDMSILGMIVVNGHLYYFIDKSYYYVKKVNLKTGKVVARYRYWGDADIYPIRKKIIKYDIKKLQRKKDFEKYNKLLGLNEH